MWQELLGRSVMMMATPISGPFMLRWVLGIAGKSDKPWNMFSAILQWVSLILREENPLQTARKLRESQQNSNETAVWSDGNGVGWVWNCHQDLFPWSDRETGHPVSHSETIPITGLGSKYDGPGYPNNHSCRQERLGFRELWWDCVPRADTIDAAAVDQCSAGH